MKSYYIFSLLLWFILLSGCTNSELVEHWKDPEIAAFEAQKVLVLAMTDDAENRSVFEEGLVASFQEKGVNAVVSAAFFDQHFNSRPQTEAQLAEMESQLLAQGYDAILVSKVIGAEDKVSLVQGYRNFSRTFDNFESDYAFNQDLFDRNQREEVYTVYQVQSALYCICPEKARQVIWRASINVNHVDTDKKAIRDYTRLLLKTLAEQQLLIPSS